MNTSNQTWMTHQISNQFDELQDYNLFSSDTVLHEILKRYGSHDQATLCDMGKVVGSAEYYQYADLANKHTPILHAFDARGRRKQCANHDILPVMPARRPVRSGAPSFHPPWRLPSGSPRTPARPKSSKPFPSAC